MRPARPSAIALPALVAGLLLATAPNARADDVRRLGRDVQPKLQVVRLVLDPTRPDYSGAVHIDLTVATATESFRLYAQDMDVIRVGLTGSGGELPVRFETNQAGQLLVHAESSLAPGDYGLDIDFRNQFDTRANGLYRVKSGVDWYCFTQFEAKAAREAFPCWDEPEFKIPFEVTVTAPEGDAVVSNTPIAKQTVVGGERTVVFTRTPPLPSYLVAIAAGPFEFVPIPGMSIPGRVVTVKGSSKLAAEAVRVTPRILAALEKYFGRPYPYAKLDLIGVPEFAAGAMENAGAITFREERLLIDPAATSPRERYDLASTTAHELAHMWFGDLVTMEWWDDLWLNESFASWMAAKITDQLFPAYHAPLRGLTGRQSAMETDARLSTRPIRQAVAAMANVDRLFDELSYNKGHAVLGMIENWLGPEVFRRGVLAYLKEHEWKNATAADLWRALGGASGKDVASVAASFLDQGGVPMVSVELEPGGKLRLEQRRFLNDSASASRATSWKIPVSLKYSDGRQEFSQSVLLEQPEQTVALARTSAPVWVHPDAGERGYYRWSVPPDMLQAIAVGAARSLDARERVGFIGNLSALLDAGEVRGDAYLRTLELFADDAQPEVIAALIDALRKVNDAFVIPAYAGPFSHLVKRMLRPALTRFGISPRKNEAEPVSLLRPMLLATLGVQGHDPDILAWAGVTARQYLAHPASVDPSIAGTALDLAARGGDAALFDEYRAHFESASVPSDRARFLNALGYFRDGTLVHQALEYALSGPLRPQEILTIPRNIAEDELSRETVWEWLEENHPRIVRRIPPYRVPRLAQLAECCQESRVDAANVFFSRPDIDYPGTREELAKVTDRIRDCARLRKREGQRAVTYIGEVARAARASGPMPAEARPPGDH